MKQESIDLAHIFQRFEGLAAYRQCLDDLTNKISVTITGLNGLAISLLVYKLHDLFKSPILLIAGSSTEAEDIHDDLDFLSPASSVCYLPEVSDEHRFFPQSESVNDFFVNQTLRNLVDAQNPIVVSSLTALQTRFPTRIRFDKHRLPISVGLKIKRAVLVSRLIEMGYSKVDLVENQLDFCIKGGIVDVFPADEHLPFRLEFDGDTIASIRSFNPESQLSINHVESISINASARALSDDNDYATIFDYLPSDTILFVLHRETIEPQLLEKYYNLLSHQFMTIYHNDLLQCSINFGASIPNIPADSFDNLQRYLSSVKDAVKESLIFIFCSSEAQRERLHSLFKSDGVHVVIGSISKSTEIVEAGIFLYADHDLFKRTRRPTIYRELAREMQLEQVSPQDIMRGDFMVHLNYGIGRFLGLEQVSAFGAVHECLVLEYEGHDKVFVPIEKIHLVHKYKGTEGFIPRLNRLGSTDWERTKLRTRRTIYKISEELINLYARRLESPGFAFPPDTDLQIQMESEFLYDETADQVSATAEIKKDMESARPMDRLLCGDVGFGKTEVAIRAAFKAVSASKQVAVLVPTTILADQHFAVFSQRLRGFPVKIAMLTRFVSKKEQKRTLVDLEGGNVDIVIGTHRLLSKDVHFKDLGLLIIDEEHRFGVKAKEHFKLMRSHIDVLSLSATPIPRSLHLALIGARDFSVINTPPKSRLPVFTEIIPFNKDLIKSAVRRELDRGGQVYFVHNDIQSIALITNKLQDLLPDVPIAFVHGQMKERVLESIMRAFIANEISVLVTTTIIESGIDIANVNTIFINNAHHFGLSQLYQLRGRVGRSNRRAYAYLIVPHFSKIKSEAILKLQAICRYTALGSGYNLALHDLEIRGVGNIFGIEQSGNIHAIGYDLYVKILREALQKQKAIYENKLPEAVIEDPIDVEIVFPYAAFFPEEHIPHQALRLNYYRRLASAQSLSEIDQIEAEIVDIYGKLTPEGRGLFEMHHLRLLCARLAIKKLALGRESQIIWANQAPFKKPLDLLAAIREITARLRLTFKFLPNDNLCLMIFFNSKEPIIEAMKQFLNLLCEAFNL